MRGLRFAAVMELASLTVLLVNLATVHLKAVTGLVGPVHGTAYLAVIASTLLLPTRSGVRFRALLPGVGGLLAMRAARADRAPPS